TNSVWLDQLSPEEERKTISQTLSRIAEITGRKPVGWLGSGLAETWHTLDFLADEGCLYVADWVNDDQPYFMDIVGQRLSQFRIPTRPMTRRIPRTVMGQSTSSKR